MAIPEPLLPDLSALSAAELRKVPDATARQFEQDGQFYSTILRQLQIRPDRYTQFYNGVLRPNRNKHDLDIKRCSSASLKNVTGMLLRGYGYIVWKANTPWLLEQSELEEGEVRLVYDRKRGLNHPQHER